MQARNVQRSESLTLHMPLLAHAGTQLSEIEKNIQKLESMPWPEIWGVFQTSHTATFQLAVTRLSRRSISAPRCFIGSAGSDSRAKNILGFQSPPRIDLCAPGFRYSRKLL